MAASIYARKMDRRKRGGPRWRKVIILGELDLVRTDFTEKKPRLLEMGGGKARTSVTRVAGRNAGGQKEGLNKWEVDTEFAGEAEEKIT